MPFDYGAPILMKCAIGRLIRLTKDPASLYELRGLDGVRLYAFFERRTSADAPYPTAKNSKEYKWGLKIVDFNGHTTLRIQVKAWLESAKDFRYMLQDEWSESKLILEWSPKLCFTKAIHSEVEKWQNLQLCVKVRPRIEKTIAVNHYTQALADAFENEKCANVKIKVGDREFKVAEFVLRVHSKVFSKMLARETEEQEPKVIEIKNANPGVVEKMLEFMYTGNVKNLGPVAAELLPLADRFQLRDLCDMCADQMYEESKVETIIKQLELVARYDHLTDFKRRVLKFTKAHIDQICQLPGWNEFGKKNVPIIMKLLPTPA